MIIFKLILASFKQNLRSGVQNFIFGAQEKYKELYLYIYIYIYIYTLFEPTGLKVRPPLVVY